MKEIERLITKNLQEGNVTAVLQADSAVGKPEWEISLEMPGSDPHVWAYAGYIGDDFYRELNAFLSQHVTSESLRGLIRVTLEDMMRELDKTD